MWIIIFIFLSEEIKSIPGECWIKICCFLLILHTFSNFTQLCIFLQYIIKIWNISKMYYKRIEIIIIIKHPYIYETYFIDCGCLIYLSLAYQKIRISLRVTLFKILCSFIHDNAPYIVKSIWWCHYPTICVRVTELNIKFIPFVHHQHTNIIKAESVIFLCLMKLLL